jgi:hypothetical protein
MSKPEIDFNSDSLYLTAQHLGNGRIQIFTTWPDGTEKGLEDYAGKVKVWELTPLDGELVLNRVYLRTTSRDDGGLDITDIG